MKYMKPVQLVSGETYRLTQILGPFVVGEKVTVRLQGDAAYLTCLVTPGRQHLTTKTTVKYRCKKVRK